MGKKSGSKYYAIRGGRGGYSGVVNTWAECETYVSKVSGVKFKSFASRAEADAFVNGSSNSIGVRKTIGKSKPRASRAKSSRTSAAPRDDTVVVYTDGACTNNGNHGARAGYGVFFGFNNPLNVSEPLPGTKATNQRAEMTAVAVAMRVAMDNELVSEAKGLQIFTDSEYTLNGMTKWVKGWKAKGWKTSSGSDVKNKDLWEQLDEMQGKYKDKNIDFDIMWVKGHVGNPGNEAADRLAVLGANK